MNQMSLMVVQNKTNNFSATVYNNTRGRIGFYHGISRASKTRVLGLLNHSKAIVIDDCVAGIRICGEFERVR